MEYEEVDYFIDKTSGIKSRLKILNQLDLIESIRWAITSTGSKKGGLAYTQWRRNQIDLLTPKDETEKTVFDRLREVPKVKTIFDKLKRR